ncbi:MAG: hypothetical protein A3J38_03255 [Gammaproteobacteria bacterium RIFCSPHIGHO2_12_FULL_45_9]|nr:MAG: hypothetical protein A3J38_03255 [Gammaproteobacteria bacterium RIFCSPHIGHO2_12_FULL_45_9]
MHFLQELGEDTNRPDLVDTPRRFSEMLHYFTQGNRSSVDGLFEGALLPATHSGMVVVKDLKFAALCEHHLLPFSGHCHIAYLPNTHWIGLSRLGKIVERLAHRLHMQERLTADIAQAIQTGLNSHGVAVMVVGEHFCMRLRSHEQTDASVTTIHWLGAFEAQTELQMTFLQQVRQLP